MSVLVRKGKDVGSVRSGAATTTGSLAYADAITDKLLLALLLLVLFAAPFEVGYPPLGRILFATFTNLELVLSALGAALALRVLVSRRTRQRVLRLPLLLPILALIGACVLSTLLVDPRSVDELEAALVRIHTAPDLRSTLKVGGLRRSAMFTWENTARATLGVYNHVLRGAEFSVRNAELGMG